MAKRAYRNAASEIKSEQTIALTDSFVQNYVDARKSTNEWYGYAVVYSVCLFRFLFSKWVSQQTAQFTIKVVLWNCIHTHAATYVQETGSYIYEHTVTVPCWMCVCWMERLVVVFGVQFSGKDAAIACCFHSPFPKIRWQFYRTLMQSHWSWNVCITWIMRSTNAEVVCTVKWGSHENPHSTY